MNYIQLNQKDLFDFKNTEYKFAHCISKDYKLGAGIAKQFCKHFNMRNRLINSINEGIKPKVPGCVFIDPVFNLITKDRYFHKPTYDSLSGSLYEMKQLSIDMNINKIVMPQIGCGLDGLKWSKVKKIIYEHFNDLDIEIVVCCFKK